MPETETSVYVPAPVRRRAIELVGPADHVEALGGLSGRTVAAVRGERDTVVVKGPVSASEIAIAGPLSGVLARHGVLTPRVDAVVDLGDEGSWLVMEHLPDPLPRERWGADPAVLAALRGLHSVPRSVVEGIEPRYRPRWDDELTSRACAVLGLTGPAAERITALATAAQPLFAPTCVVSADPNPMNWRLDGDGRPVLLDWERITLASPAIDLAIVLPGLPDRPMAAAAVEAYGDDAITADDVLLAKAWSVIELAGQSAPGTDARDVVQAVAPAFRDWIAATFQ